MERRHRRGAAICLAVQDGCSSAIMPCSTNDAAFFDREEFGCSFARIEQLHDPFRDQRRASARIGTRTNRAAVMVTIPAIPASRSRRNASWRVLLQPGLGEPEEEQLFFRRSSNLSFRPLQSNGALPIATSAPPGAATSESRSPKRQTPRFGRQTHRWFHHLPAAS